MKKSQCRAYYRGSGNSLSEENSNFKRPYSVGSTAKI